MCIEVAYEDGVVLEVEESVEIGGVQGWAGGVRGEVEVDDVSGGPIEVHSDPVNLQGAVSKVGEVKVGEAD